MKRVSSRAFPQSDTVFCFEAKDVVTGDSFDVIRCLDTGTAFTHPIPDNLDRYYPEDYRHFHPIIKALFRWRYRRFVSEVVSRLGSRGRVLEVGCGSGWMLKAFDEMGWDTVGLERSERTARDTAESTGLRILSGGLDDFEDSTGFDLVVLYNVLEHLHSPREALKAIHDLLNPGGVLVVSVPNFDSWQAQAAKAAWFHLDVPRHLHHFTPSGLEALLAQAGLTAGRKRNVSIVLDVFGWVQSLENLIFAEPNTLHRVLSSSSMGRDWGWIRSVSLLLISGMLACLAGALSASSWLFGKGALMEVWARKEL